MGAIKVVLPDDLEEDLRNYISKEIGYHKGALSETVQKALRLYLVNPTSQQIITETSDTEDLRSLHPGKYLGVVEGEVKYVCDDMAELFGYIQDEPQKVIVIHPTTQNREVRLGWRSTTNS